MANTPLVAHSLAEALCYIMLKPCPHCHAGPVCHQSTQVQEQHIRTTLRLNCRCPDCDADSAIRFAIDSTEVDLQHPPVINPTVQPSSLLDVVHWLTLYHRFKDDMDRAADKPAAREHGYQAALCLEEALKFFDADNDLPPDSAFFADKHRETARAHPTQFTRQRLLALKDRLPDLTASQRSTSRRGKRPWWRFWS